MRFEDFETDALGMTELRLYRYHVRPMPGLGRGPRRHCRLRGPQKGYKKNRYSYDPRTVSLVEQHWHFAIDDWGYERAK